MERAFRKENLGRAFRKRAGWRMPDQHPKTAHLPSNNFSYSFILYELILHKLILYGSFGQAAG